MFLLTSKNKENCTLIVSRIQMLYNQRLTLASLQSCIKLRASKPEGGKQSAN